LREELSARPGRAVEQENGVRHRSARIQPRRAQRAVVEAKLRQNLARPESKGSQEKVARRRLRDWRRNTRSRQKDENQKGEPRRADGPPFRQTASHRRARRRASEKRTIAAASRTVTWGQSSRSGSSLQNTFMNPSMA